MEVDGKSNRVDRGVSSPDALFKRILFARHRVSISIFFLYVRSVSIKKKKKEARIEIRMFSGRSKPGQRGADHSFYPSLKLAKPIFARWY